MTSTAPARQWQHGDPEPPVGTTVIRADGVRATLWDLGWFPGPYNWTGILSLGPATEDTTPVPRVDIVDPTDREAVAAWRAGVVSR